MAENRGREQMRAVRVTPSQEAARLEADSDPMQLWWLLHSKGEAGAKGNQQPGWQPWLRKPHVTGELRDDVGEGEQRLQGHSPQ